MNAEQYELTIGLPVYNGERFLIQAIESIMNQSYQDFNVIISDNGSTDGTQNICENFEQMDKRISYHRYNNNKGAAWNFNNVFRLSNSNYFKWAAADDYCSPDLFEKCINELKSDDSISLAFGKIINVNENGDESFEMQYSELIHHDDPVKRFNYMINLNPSCMAVFGIFRSSLLQRSALIGNYPSSDKNLIAQISLAGKLHEIPDSFFYRRVHFDKSCSVYPSEYSRSEWFDPVLDGKVVFPGWRLLQEYTKTVGEFGQNFNTRIFGYLYIGKWAVLNFTYLLKNVLVYILHLLFKPGFYEAKNKTLSVKEILVNRFKKK
jgi:glycosyltransferase involved in cell wall biosynthesis